jgi:hypothetical protein
MMQEREVKPFVWVADDTFMFVSACDPKERTWQGMPSIYCQCDEHDAGYSWGAPMPPLHMLGWLMLQQGCRGPGGLLVSSRLGHYASDFGIPGMQVAEVMPATLFVTGFVDTT